MNEPTKAVLSKGGQVEPTKEAWTTEIKWRAGYTSTSELDQAIDEIVRLQIVLNDLSAKYEELKMTLTQMAYSG